MRRVWAFLILSVFTFQLAAFCQTCQANVPDKSQSSLSTQHENPADYIDISKKAVLLNSRLEKEYVGYSFTVNNNYNKPLTVLSGQVIDGTDGQQAYMKVEKDPMVTWLWFGLIGYYVTSKKNKKAKLEAQDYTNQVPLGILNSGDTLKFNSLMPIGTKPQVKLIVQDSATQEIFSLVK